MGGINQKQVVIHPARRAHPLGRMLFSAGLIAAVLLVRRDISLLLPLLAVSVSLLYWICASWQPVMRAARLLLWLVIPVLLLHLFFTPGALLWPGGFIPLSREGLHEGLWLGLRLCALFYAAMLLSRSLSREEWTYYCLALPYPGSVILPYVRLSLPMREMVSRSLAKSRSRLDLSAGLKDSPKLMRELGEVIATVWHGSAGVAEKVIRQWNEHEGPRRPQGGAMSAGLMAIAGMLMPLGIWMAG